MGQILKNVVGLEKKLMKGSFQPISSLFKAINARKMKKPWKLFRH